MYVVFESYWSADECGLRNIRRRHCFRILHSGIWSKWFIHSDGHRDYRRHWYRNVHCWLVCDIGLESDVRPNRYTCFCFRIPLPWYHLFTNGLALVALQFSVMRNCRWLPYWKLHCSSRCFSWHRVYGWSSDERCRLRYRDLHRGFRANECFGADSDFRSDRNGSVRNRFGIPDGSKLRALFFSPRFVCFALVCHFRRKCDGRIHRVVRCWAGNLRGPGDR
jgi:hypothetical protein